MKKLFYLLLLISSNLFGQNFVENELLIQLNPKTNSATFFRALENDLNITIENTACISVPMNIYQVHFSNILNPDELLKLVKRKQVVINAQFNHFVEERETIPNDPNFTTEAWHLKNTGQTGGLVDADIDATDAWDITTGGVTTHNDTIVVCILEGSGVDINHVDLKDNIWKNLQEIPNNGIDDDNNGYVDDFLGWNVVSNDDIVTSGSHGTRVAGMIGAKGNNSIGISGVSQNVKMMIVKGQQASNEASVIAAYSYPLTMRKIYNSTNGQEGAFVVATNASWGINGGDPDNSPLWCALYDSLGQVGIINMGATSNSNVNVDIIGDLPTTCPSDYLIGVTMTNSNDVRAGTGYGPINIDLAAPGQAVYLTLPNDIYGSTSGTSFATPCVVGAAALIYASPCPDFINFTKAYPDSAALKIKALLLDEVDPIVSLTNDVLSGGRLNVNNSIQALINSCNSNSCIAPYNIDITNLTDTNATISWNGFSADYSLFIQANNDPFVEIPLTGVFNFNFDTLTPCTDYTLRIKAICGANTSEFSYPISFRTDGCCENPTLSIIDTQNQSLTIGWQSILYASDYTLRYKNSSDITWINISNATSNTAINLLEECTEYEFQIKTTCTDSTRGFSESYFFKTKGCGACYDLIYCDVTGTNSNTEWIDTIILGNTKIGTGNNGGWLVYDEVDISFLPNSSQLITIIPGYSGTHYTQKFSIWIDFNQNGIFDSNEKVINELSNNGPVTGLMNIPSNAVLGITKMRIGMIGSSSLVPENCPTNIAYGEYEDYCVYIGLDASIIESQNQFTIYPNPATNTIIIQANEIIENLLIKSLDGKLIKSYVSPQSSIDVSDLPSGIYLIQIKNNQFNQTIKLIKN